MGWTITPNIDIDENGIVNFPENTGNGDIDYRLKYENGDCGYSCEMGIRQKSINSDCNCMNANLTILSYQSEIDYSGGTVSIVCSSNCGTITADTTNGRFSVNGNTINITIDENETTKDRQIGCNIWVVGNEKCPKRIIITQKGKENGDDDSCGCNGIVLGKIDTVPSSGGTVTMKYSILCGKPMVVIDDNWIVGARINKDSREVVFDIGPNDSLENRTAKLVFGIGDKECKDFYITQMGEEVEETEGCDCRLSKFNISFETSNVVEPTGGTVTIKCNLNECVESITYTYGEESGTSDDGTISITVGENDSPNTIRSVCRISYNLKDGNVCNKAAEIVQLGQEEEAEECVWEWSTSDMIENKIVDPYDNKRLLLENDIIWTGCSANDCSSEVCDDKWVVVYTFEHPSCVKIRLTPSASWLDVGSLEVAKGSKISAKTNQKNNTSMTWNGRIWISYTIDGNNWYMDQWYIPITVEGCREDEPDACDGLECKDFSIDSSIYTKPSEPQNPVELATYEESPCFEIVEITSTSDYAGATISNITHGNGVIMGDLPSLINITDDIELVTYTITVKYKLTSEDEDETSEDEGCSTNFEITQWVDQEEDPCFFFSCGDISVVRLTETFEETGGVQTIATYTLDCGVVTGVSVDGADGVDVTVVSYGKNEDTDSGQIVVNLPNLSECGHAEELYSYMVTVYYTKIGDETSTCESYFSIEQKANIETCCTCDKITILATPAGEDIPEPSVPEETICDIVAVLEPVEMDCNGGTLNFQFMDYSIVPTPPEPPTPSDPDQNAFEVDYTDQLVFTITSTPKCPLDITLPDWMYKKDIEDGVYEIYVTENELKVDRVGEVVIKDTDGTECTKYKVTQHVNGVLLLPAFDYMTFVYRWSSSAGSDLDTASVVLNSGISGLDNVPAGYSCAGNSNTTTLKYLRYGGDNTGTGTESHCLYLKNILDDCPESTTKITIKLYGNWYSSRGTGNITMEYYTYKGGTMTAPSSAGNLFTNSGGEQVSHDSKSVNVGIQNHAGCSLSSMSLIGTLEYNIDTKMTTFTT